MDEGSESALGGEVEAVAVAVAVAAALAAAAEAGIGPAAEVPAGIPEEDHYGMLGELYDYCVEVPEEQLRRPPQCVSRSDILEQFH